MRNRVLTCIAIVPLFILSLNAKPKIEFDTKSFDCGILVEGKSGKVNAVFTVKNSGNETLRLESVRPGCGCTVVTFDSLIQPGKTTKIESVVDLKGYPSGPVSKTISVVSNAENEPTVRLTILATVQSVIDVSEKYLSFAGPKDIAPKVVYLSSGKADLKIEDIHFSTQNEGSSAPAWQEKLNIPVTYSMSSGDSVRADGYKVYKLQVYPVASREPMYGEFIIKTNHPGKKEISIRGQFGG